MLGAFGAHGLEAYLKTAVPDAAEQSGLLATWEVAARYQMYHALSLICLGLLAVHRPGKLLQVAGILFVAGVLVFSGLLYALVLTRVKFLGAFVPIGGTFMIIGWIVFAIAARRLRSTE
jgi:uncharacterized membrane protein YgdD (TMEM256/DUF423 family)